MLQGKFPFKGVNDNDLFKRIKKANYELIHPISDNASTMISALLHINPSERPSAQQVNSSKCRSYYSEYVLFRY